jgi:hypothetical protein
LRWEKDFTGAKNRWHCHDCYADLAGQKYGMCWECKQYWLCENCIGKKIKTFSDWA